MSESATSIDSLEGCSTDVIAGAFDRAFADYYIKSSTSSAAWLAPRMQKNGVDLRCSAGAFAGGELVGFTLVGLGEHGGIPAAFDAGTGIVPAYRGSGLAGKMFAFSLSRVRKRNIRLFMLEVLQENAPAIRAYEKAGFHRVRSFDCLLLQREKHRRAAACSAFLTTYSIDRHQVGALSDESDWLPSWENSIVSILRVPDRLICLGTFEQETCVGTLVYYPTLNWIMNLVVRRTHRRRGIGSALLANLWDHVDDGVKTLRMVNVNHDDEGMLRFLKGLGFEIYTRQYEMQLSIF